MSPLLKSVEEAGIQGIIRKRNPVDIKPVDYFREQEDVKAVFARLISASPRQIAIIPSASYGLITALHNVPAGLGNHAITIADEFPSGYYALQAWCRQHGKSLNVISPPDQNRGQGWNERLLEAIHPDTAVVLISSIHWTDGTLFNLEAIARRCNEVNARLIVDGTQSVGVVPINVSQIPLHALVSAGYKWLMGPYSIGMAYFNESMNDGTPIEYSWMNRENAEDFSQLVSYNSNYKAGAARYQVGEFSNFALLPMIGRGIEQVLEWTPNAIEEYSAQLARPLVQHIKSRGYQVEEDDYRCHHLFGFRMPRATPVAELVEKFSRENIIVSLRGDCLRVSIHVYNTKNDINALMAALA